jgi:hypothetical protein
MILWHGHDLEPAKVITRLTLVAHTPRETVTVDRLYTQDLLSPVMSREVALAVTAATLPCLAIHTITVGEVAQETVEVECERIKTLHPNRSNRWTRFLEGHRLFLLDLDTGQQ